MTILEIRECEPAHAIEIARLVTHRDKCVSFPQYGIQLLDGKCVQSVRVEGNGSRFDAETGLPDHVRVIIMIG